MENRMAGQWILPSLFKSQESTSARPWNRQTSQQKSPETMKWRAQVASKHRSLTSSWPLFPQYFPHHFVAAKCYRSSMVGNIPSGNDCDIAVEHGPVESSWVLPWHLHGISASNISGKSRSGWSINNHNWSTWYSEQLFDYIFLVYDSWSTFKLINI